jgi:DNA-binding XRE family transcriptional regulator
MYNCNGYDIMRQEILILIHLQTQTQHSIDTGSYKHNIELKIKYRRLIIIIIIHLLFMCRVNSYKPITDTAQCSYNYIMDTQIRI